MIDKNEQIHNSDSDISMGEEINVNDVFDERSDTNGNQNN